MSRASDYDNVDYYSDFKQNFDLVSPEEIQYYSDLLVNDFEELNRRSCILGLSMPKLLVDFKKWLEENLVFDQEVNLPVFFRDILMIRKVMIYACYVKCHFIKIQNKLSVKHD